jgi:predicted DNA-binding protein
MKNPRVSVSLNPSDVEVMHLICEKRKMSMSSLTKKIVEDWLEEYEDTLLSKRAEDAERRFIEGGCKTVSHEELCRELGIESNIQETHQKTSKNYQKTSKKELFVPLKRGFSISREKSENP